MKSEYVDTEEFDLPAGPWNAEPNYAAWRDEATGLPCVARRNRLGAWCGYVGVSPEHPWHGKDYDGVDVWPDVHGGLTYASGCNETTGVCHVPAEGESDDFWWFGFDTAHLGDLVPGMLRYSDSGLGETYRDLNYVKAETGELARQLAEVRS